MQSRITVVTLGVADLARSRSFYAEGLGFPIAAGSDENIVFLRAGGVVLGLYPRRALAEDAHVPPEGSGFGGITLACNMATKPEVDAALERAQTAGARILKSAREVFWGGYYGYFADPDGYPWEVAFNPFWKLDEEGQVLLPE